MVQHVEDGQPLGGVLGESGKREGQHTSHEVSDDSRSPRARSPQPHCTAPYAIHAAIHPPIHPPPMHRRTLFSAPAMKSTAMSDKPSGKATWHRYRGDGRGVRSAPVWLTRTHHHTSRPHRTANMYGGQVAQRGSRLDGRGCQGAARAALPRSGNQPHVTPAPHLGVHDVARRVQHLPARGLEWRHAHQQLVGKRAQLGGRAALRLRWRLRFG